MKKLFALLIVLVGATVAMAYIYFSNINEKEKANDIALHVATAQTALVFNYTSSKDFYNLMQDQDLLSAFLDSTSIAKTRTMFSTFVSNSTVLNLLDNQKIYLSIVPDSGELALLLCTQLISDADGNALTKLINKAENTTALPGGLVKISKGDADVFLGQNGALVVLSSSRKLVLASLKTSEKRINTNFENFIKEAGRHQENSLMTLFVNYARLPDLMSQLRQRPEKQWASLKTMEGFGELNYNFSKGKLIFHGRTIINSSSYYQLFADMDPQNFSISNILPASIANYTMYGVNSYSAMSKAMAAHGVDEKKNSQKLDVFNQVKEKYLLDLPEIMTKNFKNQFMTFQLSSGERLGAVALVNGDRFNHLMSDLGTFYSPDVVVWKEKGILNRMFGEAFRDFEQPYIAIKNNYLIFANSAATIQSYLNMYANEPLLMNNADYIAFRNEFPSEGNISVFINLKTSRTLFQRNLKRTYSRQLTDNEKLGSFNSFSFQLAGDKGKFQANLLLSKTEPILSDSLTIQ